MELNETAPQLLFSTDVDFISISSSGYDVTNETDNASNLSSDEILTVVIVFGVIVALCICAVCMWGRIGTKYNSSSPAANFYISKPYKTAKSNDPENLETMQLSDKPRDSISRKESFKHNDGDIQNPFYTDTPRFNSSKLDNSDTNSETNDESNDSNNETKTKFHWSRTNSDQTDTKSHRNNTGDDDVDNDGI